MGLKVSSPLVLKSNLDVAYGAALLTFISLAHLPETISLKTLSWQWFHTIDCKAKLKNALDSGTERLSVPPGE